ncbi:MAG: hypothetical protein AMS18_11310 [Gemmatimonas sp. SG8_17]|nr:MAG: hypothetical protein AMS18_11310 [Gemmatimonas sp. SG8_17]
MFTDGCPIQITPEMTIADLLSNFPSLERALAELSSSYLALENPALRATVAKSTTLGQLCRADGLSIGILIGKLREAAGQDSLASDSGGDAPAWADQHAAAKSLDAREMIQQGRHPLKRVMAELDTLYPGEVYQLITPFFPGPMIDLVKERGFESYTVSRGPDLYHTYYRRI